MTTVEDWEAWEEGERTKTQRHVDRVRVLGYTHWACGQVAAAQVALTKAVESMERARKRAAKALAYRDMVLAHVEQVAAVATSGDAERFTEVAQCLENLVG